MHVHMVKSCRINVNQKIKYFRERYVFVSSGVMVTNITYFASKLTLLITGN